MKIGRAKALWKVPELWKNQKAVFPQLLGPSVHTSHNAGCYWTFLKHNFPSTPWEKLRSPSVSEKSEVADTHKAMRQQVQEKASQELIDEQSHQALFVVV